PHARLLVVDHDRRRSLDAAQLEQVIDHPHERPERRRIGVDERHAPEIEVHRAGNVAGGEVFRRTEIDQEGFRRLFERRAQGVRRGQQMGIGVVGHGDKVLPPKGGSYWRRKLLDWFIFTMQSSNVDVTRALDQIAEIHQQIAKGEVYRGYRSLPVALSGLIGLIAAWLQPSRLGAADPVGFVLYWTAIAAARRVVGQFLPSVAGGAGIALCFTHLSAALVPLLPGLWAICFGIGTFASRPYLPKASGWIALFYYAAGFTLLWIARGVGPLLAALVLWWNLERT